MWLLQSPVNPKPCGTFSWPTSKSPSSPFFLAKSLLLPKPRGKEKHSKTSWSSLLSFRTAWACSPLQNHMDLDLSTCFRASWFSHLLQSRVVYSFFQSRMVSSPFTLEPRGLLYSMAARPRFKSQCPSSFAAPFLTPPTVSYT